MTATLHTLRSSLRTAREEHGTGSSQAQEAFETLVRAAAASGTPLDALRRHTANEVERFFAFTIPGPDGHVYWEGLKDFRRNDGGHTRPHRWWWKHRYGSLDPQLDLASTCGEQGCINPEHSELQRLRGSRRHWTEERIIGAIQVAAMRLGRTPSSTEWLRLHLVPSSNIVLDRFGTWKRAREAAGVEPSANGRHVLAPRPAFTRAELLAGIRLVHSLTGKWPTVKEYNACRDALAEAGLPRDADCVYRLFGSWVVAKKQAQLQEAEGA